MSDVVAFIRARVDEDEAAARAAAGKTWTDGRDGDPAPGRWRVGDGGAIENEDPHRNVAYCSGDDYEHTRIEPADAVHIARHDPARVLRQVGALRRVVERAGASSPTYDEAGNFTGFSVRNCREHRTTGIRAWCFDCSEWCYPNDGCGNCVDGDEPTLCALASTWSDHPDHQKEWTL